MQGAKPWQLVLVVVALLALVTSIGFQIFNSDDVRQSNNLTLIDYKTGELFSSDIPEGKSAFLPATNPGTKEDTLIPVVQRDGQFYVAEQYVGFARSRAPKSGTSIFADAQTALVIPKNMQPVKAELFN